MAELDTHDVDLLDYLVAKVKDEIVSEIKFGMVDSVKMGIAEYQKITEAKRKSVFLRNTKILLKHYKEFEAHIHGAITCKQELITSDLADDMTDDEFERLMKSDLREDVFIESIQRSRSRTFLLLSNIDSYMLQLKKICMANHRIHKFQMLEEYYVFGYTQEVIAERHGCHAPQVNAWISEMTKSLSRLMFGKDAIEDL